MEISSYLSNLSFFSILMWKLPIRMSTFYSSTLATGCYLQRDGWLIFKVWIGMDNGYIWRLWEVLMKSSTGWRRVLIKRVCRFGFANDFEMGKKIIQMIQNTFGYTRCIRIKYGRFKCLWENSYVGYDF